MNYKKAVGDLAHVRFHSFPSRPHEVERRQKWILAVRRIGEDGKPWEPSKNSRICSLHFVSGKPSNIESSPAYVPTIFPDVYKRSQSSAGAVDNFNRYHARNQKKVKVSSSTVHTDSLHAFSADNATSSPEPLVYEDDEWMEDCDRKTVSTETDAVDECHGQLHLFLSTTSSNNAECQVTHSEEAQKVSRHVGPDSRTWAFLGFESAERNEDALQELCSVSNNMFALLLSLMPELRVRTTDMTVQNKLLCFLMKLKLGLSFVALSVLFSVDQRTISRTFYDVLNIIYARTKNWISPPSMLAVKETMPQCFKDHYPNCRFIIDCTEIKTETPPKLDQRNLMYSNYKGAYTLKFLVGISPNGAVTFLSKAFGGRTSDSSITVESGFLDLHQPGDCVLADKGFPSIRTVLAEKNAVLVMPPFSKGDGQFSSAEMNETYAIAKCRIHVERVIQRIKIFNILNYRVPVTLIPYMQKVVHVCCVIANYQPHIIRPEEA
ncbi:uncharacterized protein LOC135378506 [Ornithodoros turicata]|uniref:uncharacterized protein LOC135378506 n=1 Tax=Ornithodoros turicata TaxID=34597 RepID=UPI00313A446F